MILEFPPCHERGSLFPSYTPTNSTFAKALLSKCFQETRSVNMDSSCWLRVAFSMQEREIFPSSMQETLSR